MTHREYNEGEEAKRGILCNVRERMLVNSLLCVAYTGNAHIHTTSHTTSHTHTHTIRPQTRRKKSLCSTLRGKCKDANAPLARWATHSHRSPSFVAPLHTSLPPSLPPYLCPPKHGVPSVKPIDRYFDIGRPSTSTPFHPSHRPKTVPVCEALSKGHSE